MFGVADKKHPVALGLFLALGIASPVYTAETPVPDKASPPSIELARGLIDAEQFGKALSVLRQLDIDNDEAVAQVDLLLGRLYLAVGKPNKAEDYFEHAGLSSLGAEAEASLGLAESELAQGNLVKARKNASNALKSDPDLVAAQLVIARADQRIGRGGEAMTRLLQLQANQPNSEEVSIVLARYVAQQQGAGAGAGVLQSFVAQNPTSAAAYDVLGQLLLGSGRKADALDARFTAKRLYMDRGQTGRAEAMAAWIAAIDPNYAPPKPVEAAPKPEQTAKTDTKSEPPKPIAAPQVPVEAKALPAPVPQQKPSETGAAAVRKPTVWAMLPHPEALPFPQGSMLMTGSGIVVEGGREIITNRHVIEGMGTIYVRNGTGHVRKARVVKVSSDDDLALLEIASPFPEGAVLPLSDIIEPATGRAAIVMGFPLINILGDEQPELTEGIVAKNLGLANDPKMFQMTAKVNKGNSGGPVFDKRGHLIGITVAKMDTVGIHQQDGSAVEDINLGIKANRILGFLGKSPNNDRAPAPEMSLEDLYQEMLPRAVLIAAQK